MSYEERRDDEPDDDPPGQCDWGYCDKLATQWRWLERFGWLPICDGCAWLADSRQALDWTEHWRARQGKLDEAEANQSAAMSQSRRSRVPARTPARTRWRAHIQGR